MRLASPLFRFICGIATITPTPHRSGHSVPALMKDKALTPLQIERKARVLQCTREMLAEQGYEGLQMRLLAERAGVALMTLYNRFGNKDDLVLLSLQELLGELAARAAASGKEGIAFVVHNTEIIADQILETPRYAKAMALMLFNGQIGSPIVETLLVNNVRQNHERIHQMIDAGEITTVINQPDAGIVREFIRSD